jgi:hypothetical protein
VRARRGSKRAAQFSRRNYGVVGALSTPAAMVAAAADLPVRSLRANSSATLSCPAGAGRAPAYRNSDIQKASTIMRRRVPPRKLPRS